MNKPNEQNYIDDLISHTEDSLRLLSNHEKATRERMVCAAFLRCLGIQFSKEYIISPQGDPPDVTFEDARFEVREMLDEERVRGKEFKDRLQVLKKAKDLNATLLPYKSPTPISYASLFNIITYALSKKANLYGVQGCSLLDALLYINLEQRFLDLSTSIPDFRSLISQGWRSVSFVYIPYSHIIFAKDTAPEFLKQYEGQTRNEWNNPDTFFDLN